MYIYKNKQVVHVERDQEKEAGISSGGCSSNSPLNF